MDDRQAIENLILPFGFRIIPSLSEKQGRGLVYGRIVQTRVCYRIITPFKQDETGAYCSNGGLIYLIFVAKTAKGKIVRVGSERIIETHKGQHVWVPKLREFIFEWKAQREARDCPCNKCVKGVYRFRRNGQVVERPCNRCNGKGYQNFDDQRANRAYDFAQNPDRKTDKPHWHPDPKNLRRPKQ